jgi:hypothetical protein
MVGFAENVGHDMTFLVLTEKGTIIPRSQLRKIEEVPPFSFEKDKVIARDKVSDEGASDDHNNEYVEVDTSPERLRFIPNEDLIGRAFLIDEEETGERKRATILKIFNDHSKRAEIIRNLSRSVSRLVRMNSTTSSLIMKFLILSKTTMKLPMASINHVQ